MLAAKLISKKKAIIYLIILAVSALVSFFVYQYLARGDSARPEKARPGVYIAPNPDLILPAQLEQAAIKRILEHPLFKKLEKHGDWPVKVDALGRVNPFQGF